MQFPTMRAERTGTRYYIFVSAATIVTALAFFAAIQANNALSQTGPSTPQNLHQLGTSPSTISFSWSPSAEPGVAIQGYFVYRNGAKIDSTRTATSFTDKNLASKTTYRYTVASYDTAGKISPQSTTFVSGTQAAVVQAQAQNTSGLNNSLGMSVGETLQGLSASALNTELNDFAALHVGWLRVDIEWNDVEPQNGTYYWSGIDQIVSAANAHHMKLVMMIGYTPAWARSSSCAANNDRCPPASDAAFAAFAKTAVQRYASQGVTDWEIWNEPNQGINWSTGANAGAYAALLKAVYPAIKSVEPNSTVITGGMAPTGTGGGDITAITFLSQLYADGARNYFDAVGMHPYSFPAMPNYVATWSAWAQMGSLPTSLRSVMDANGDTGKKVWLTEFGAPTGGPGSAETSATDHTFAGSPTHVTEALQSTILTTAVQMDENTWWAGPIFIYAYKDHSTSQSTNENFFGIIRPDGSTKPAYAALKNLPIP